LLRVGQSNQLQVQEVGAQGLVVVGLWLF